LNLFISILSVLFGAIIGSFLNVIIYRYSKDDMTISKPKRSVCPQCGTTLRWYDNIPILSYILLLGKCRYCGNRISKRYIIVELLTVATFLINSMISDQIIYLIGMDIIAASLIVVFFIDLDTFTISDWNSIFILIGGLLITFHTGEWAMNLITAAVTFVIMILLYYISKKGVGMGDILLITASAMALGPFKTVFAIFLASICGILAAIVLHKKMKDKIPFGPFLSIGIYLSMILGNFILQLFML